MQPRIYESNSRLTHKSLVAPQPTKIKEDPMQDPIQQQNPMPLPQLGPIIVPITVPREVDPEKEKMRLHLVEMVIMFFTDLMYSYPSDALIEVMQEILHGKQTPPAFWNFEYLEEYISMLGLPPNYLDEDFEDEKHEFLESFYG